jgi:hypothetical protein
MKNCSNPSCTQNNPQSLECFSKDSYQMNGLRCRCKNCCKDQLVKYVKNNREKVLKSYETYDKKRKDQKRINSKNSDLMRRYNITLEQYNDLLFKQNSTCLICHKHRNELNKDLVVDHCHETGKIRGLLCNMCNTSLGFIKEDFQSAINLAKYIQIHKDVL